MIVKDAIEILKSIQDGLEETKFLERCSIDMAIEALQENESLAKTVIEASELLRKQRPHGECKTCKNYHPYLEQFSYKPRGDGYCENPVTTPEGVTYMNCRDEWYCANYEKEGDAE